MITTRKAKKEDSEVLENLYTELEEDAVLYQPEHFVFSKKGQIFFRAQVFPQNMEL